MKFRPAEADLLHGEGRMDRQTDRHDELIVAFSSFAKASKTPK